MNLSILAAGEAVDGEDYTGIFNRRVRWSPGDIQTRFELGTGGSDMAFEVTILDDLVAEPTEYFEVHFTIDNTGYAYPRRVGRVTILDNDGDDGGM